MWTGLGTSGTAHSLGSRASATPSSGQWRRPTLWGSLLAPRLGLQGFCSAPFPPPASAASTLFYSITGHITQVLLAAQVSPQGSLPSCPKQVTPVTPDHSARSVFIMALIYLEGFCLAFVSSLPRAPRDQGPYLSIPASLVTSPPTAPSRPATNIYWMNECLLPWTVMSPGAAPSIPVPLPVSLWSLKQSSREAGTEHL